MGILEDSTRQSRELAFAVVAIEFSVVVVLMVYAIVKTATFRAVDLLKFYNKKWRKYLIAKNT